MMIEYYIPLLFVNLSFNGFGGYCTYQSERITIPHGSKLCQIVPPHKGVYQLDS